MYFSKKTKGIVIKRRKHQEADLILTVFSRSLGKIEVLARGLRKAKSKMASQLELFNLAQIDLYRGRSWDLIIGAENINNFSNLKAELKKLVLVHFLAEFIDKFTPLEGRDARLYDIFRNILLDLNRFSKRQAYLKRFIQGEIRILDHLGIGPSLDQCLGCGSALTGGPFKLGEGGVYCSVCSAKVKYGNIIDQRIFEILVQEVQRKGEETLCNENDLEKTNLALLSFLSAACPEQPKTLEFV